MTYLYIDESGDLGFSGKSSPYFIIACVKINEEDDNVVFGRIPKKVRAKILDKKRIESELKFSNSSEKVRAKFLELAATIPIEIYALSIDKEYTADKLKENIPILYNYLIKVMLERPIKKLDNTPLNICLDMCMSLRQRENFENYIKTEFYSTFKDLPKVNVMHSPSESNSQLQVADFICGAFGYKYNTAKLKNGHDKYVKIIQSKIVVEKNDLFRKRR